VIEMVPGTAKRCEEKREVGAVPPSERFDVAGRSCSGIRRTGSIRPGYTVAKDLKMMTFPAPSLLVSERMAACHFDQIYESPT